MSRATTTDAEAVISCVGAIRSSPCAAQVIGKPPPRSAFEDAFAKYKASAAGEFSFDALPTGCCGVWALLAAFFLPDPEVIAHHGTDAAFAIARAFGGDAGALGGIGGSTGVSVGVIEVLNPFVAVARHIVDPAKRRSDTDRPCLILSNRKRCLVFCIGPRAKAHLARRGIRSMRRFDAVVGPFAAWWLVSPRVGFALGTACCGFPLGFGQ